MCVLSFSFPYCFLAERVGCSRRAIVYYERDGKYPPAPIAAAMAGAFGLSTDSFIAPDEPTKKANHDEPDLLSDPDDRRLWRKFRLLKNLSDRDQAMVLKMIASLHDSQKAG